MLLLLSVSFLATSSPMDLVAMVDAVNNAGADDGAIDSDDNC